MTQTLVWKPSWVFIFLFFGLWPYFLLAMVTRKSMRVVAPMCRAHARHWLNRALYYWLGILFWIAYMIVVSVIIESVSIETQRWLAFGWPLAVIVWIVSVVIYSNSAIRASIIDDRSITLINVHKDFADAWHAR